jgi:hypothetical protein
MNLKYRKSVVTIAGVCRTSSTLHTIQKSLFEKKSSHIGRLDSRLKQNQELTFKGRDVNKNGKFVVLRTYFTKSETLGWMNGLVCILSGQFETTAGVFKGTGYELRL